MLLAAVLGLPGPAAAQYMGEDYPAAAGLSRTMQMAIRFFDEGKDSEAMDRFMDVLSHGEPGERNMANDYMNLITQRMYSGASITPKANTNPAPATIVDAVRTPAPPAVQRPARAEVEFESAAASRTQAGPSRGDRAVMKKEIEAKIRNQARIFLSELERNPDIRILMADRHNPRAIGIPSELLFENGIVFKRDAEKVLHSLTGLVYSLGATQAVILPEGAVVGDAKILDMRRTMGISAHFYAAGIAPPRVRVNLLNSQIDVPRGVADFRGIILIFVYNQPLALTVDSALGEESGPPVSLGVFPEKFRGDRGEGSILEFSIVEPPAGLASWRFQLKQPGGAPGADLQPLQEVIGGAPVFHQIYWNGKRNYFGADLPSGRYEAVLTATDSRNRTRTLHRWVQLEGAAPPAAAAAPKAAAPPTDLASSPPRPSYVQLAKKPGPENKRLARTKAASARAKGGLGRKPSKAKGRGTTLNNGPAEAPPAKADAGKPPAPPARPGANASLPPGGPAAQPAPQSSAAEAKARPPTGGAVNYHVAFGKGTQQMSADGDHTLGLVSDTMAYYPRENVNLVGFASSKEPDAQALAKKRADMVSGLLVNKYNVDPKRIQIQSKVVDADMAEVEIFTVSSK